MEQKHNFKPSAAFIGASWAALLIGVTAYLIGLWNAEMELNEKGYYFTVLMFGLFSAISVQKSIRDQMEGIPVTNLYYGISWFTTILSVVLLTVGLWNADLLRSEKGFYAMSFVLSLFASIAVQKNTRDMRIAELDDSFKSQPFVHHHHDGSRHE
ncbi:inner membrane protein YiaA [Aridibaculum aurantiacum]|uniref:inner membrane protein YiaA n=1 Tax=Aridibaculum aurantiacum TaxID=2810307 RepID=UPI001A95DCC5|nr:inner membrane protein YiaA [Aridibaculum aurantiacum]